MARQGLKARLKAKDGFLVLAELVGGPGFNVGPVLQFMRDLQKAHQGAIPQGFVPAGVTLPQNPGGVPNIEPADIVHRLSAEGLAGDLDLIPHVTCKDHNVAGIVSTLTTLPPRRGREPPGPDRGQAHWGQGRIRGRVVGALATDQEAEPRDPAQGRPCTSWPAYPSSFPGRRSRHSSTPSPRCCSSTTRWRRRSPAGPAF